MDILLSPEAKEQIRKAWWDKDGGHMYLDLIDMSTKASALKVLREVVGFMERYSWTTPYISFNEQIDSKEPTLYREFKIEESKWQSLKNLIKQLEVD